MEMVIMNDNQLEIRPDEYKKARQIYRAINHRLRQNMLHYIHKKARVSVTELHKYFELEQSETSMHLALLRKAGFVITHRDGRFIFYTVNYPRLKEVHDISFQLIKTPSLKTI